MKNDSLYIISNFFKKDNIFFLNPVGKGNFVAGNKHKFKSFMWVISNLAGRQEQTNARFSLIADINRSQS